MDNPTQDARYAPPQVNVDDVVPETDGPQLASRKRRLLAALLDGALQFAAMWLISKVTPFNPWAAGARGLWSVGDVTALAVSLLCFLVLNGYLLLSRGQTIGKVLTGIRIARPSGEPVSPGRLALRYGAGFLAGIVTAVIWVYSLLDCLLIFRQSRRCLHDEIADTVVLKS